MDHDQVVRDQLRTLLRGGNAHMPLDAAAAGFPMDQINARPPHVSYTPWHLLEHIRIAQRDILDFIRDPEYVSPPWPEGYWPPREQRADAADWEKTLADLRSDRAALEAIVSDPSTDLYSRIPHGDGQNILREILVVSDHNAYHTGEFAILRQVMQTWPPGHEE